MVRCEARYPANAVFDCAAKSSLLLGHPFGNKESPMQLNGIAHVYLTVSDFDACLPFYEKLLEFFEMRCLVKTDALYYCVGSRTGLSLYFSPARYCGRQ
jgi:hypothetical protein